VFSSRAYSRRGYMNSCKATSPNDPVVSRQGKAARRRLSRLEELAMGLAKEVLICKAADDPLHRAERQSYIRGLQDAIAGGEGARVALAMAVQRLEGDGR